MATLNYKQVIEYFDEISTDMSELILTMIEDRLEAKLARKAKISANLKKARAARGNKVEVTVNAVPVNESQPSHRRPGRPARVENVNDANAALTAGQQ